MVFISAGATKGDGWVDAMGIFLAAAGAGPGYELRGKKHMGTSEFPEMETPLADGTAGPNRPTFLTFAGRYMQTAATK